jgi:hypothetical protein
VNERKGSVDLTTFVGTLLELLVVGGLLDEFQDRHRQLGVRQRVGLRVHRLLALQRTGTKKKVPPVSARRARFDGEITRRKQREDELGHTIFREGGEVPRRGEGGRGEGSRVLGGRVS